MNVVIKPYPKPYPAKVKKTRKARNNQALRVLLWRLYKSAMLFFAGLVRLPAEGTTGAKTPCIRSKMGRRYSYMASVKLCPFSSILGAFGGCSAPRWGRECQVLLSQGTGAQERHSPKAERISKLSDTPRNFLGRPPGRFVQNF